MSADDPRRRVPRTDVALADPRLRGAQERLGPSLVKQAVLAAQARARAGEIAPEQVVPAAAAALPAAATTLRPVLNATGVVLHTNLGRAALSPAAVEALGIASGAVDVEYDVVDGSRARRGRGALAALRDAVPDAFVELHPVLARRSRIAEGDLVWLRSRRGEAALRARLTPDIRPDTLFVPFHWGGDGRANLLTNPALDPSSRMPEFKVCAARIDRVEPAERGRQEHR